MANNNNVNDINGICYNFTLYEISKLYGVPSDGYRIGMLVFGIVVIAYFVFGFLLFVACKKKYLRLQPRSTFIVFFTMMSGVLTTYISILSDYIGKNTIPCKLSVWLYHGSFLLIGPGIISTLLIYIYRLRKERVRMAKLLKTWKTSKAMAAKESKITINSTDSFESRASRINPTEIDDDNYSKISICELIVDFFHVTKFSKDGKIVIPENNSGNYTSAPSKVPTLTNIGSSSPQADDDDISDTGTDKSSSAFALFQLSENINE